MLKRIFPGESKVVRRFFRHKLAIMGLIILAIFGVLAILAPWITSYQPYEQDFLNLLQPPSREYILGTDSLGRDVFTRLLFAGRISLSIGIVAVSIQVFIGTMVGLVSGYFGGKVDMIFQRITDALLCFPTLLIIITVAAMLERTTIYTIMLIIGLLGWPGLARLVRAETLKLREFPFVEASRAIGCTDLMLMFKHILPNVIGPIIVAATFGVAGAIITETSLSFLGIGVQLPTPSWGNMIYSARSVSVLERNPWIWLPPGLMIALCVLSINFVGDALRDAFDPRN